MKRHGEAFVGIDTAKSRNAVAVAENGRAGEIRYLGEFENTPHGVAKLIRRLADRYERLHICYEAGPPVMACIGRFWPWGMSAWSSHRR